MQTQETTLAASRQLHQKIERLLQFSSNEDLARCARLLGLYLAMYKHEFGELSEATCDRYLNAGNTANNDPLIAEIFTSGLQEVSSLLTLIHADGSHSQHMN